MQEKSSQGLMTAQAGGGGQKAGSPPYQDRGSLLITFGIEKYFALLDSSSGGPQRFETNKPGLKMLTLAHRLFQTVRQSRF
jgi:hypothetical protein